MHSVYLMQRNPDIIVSNGKGKGKDMKRIFALLLCFALLFGCNKDENEIISGEVWVRLENAASFTLEDATVGSVSYGNVMVGEVTEYKQVNGPIYSGYCSFMIDGTQSAAGYGICGTPPLPPPFESGYYTFKVESTGAGFNVVTVTKR